ncbi:50S ribosomal protein L29 [Candidatus Micrarchaeota archaeon]|nr:50S ribosomal protein L29 [Candidatus Micrarchaeota archaeon]
MAIIKKSELVGMNTSALLEKLEELELELSRERGVTESTGKPANPGKFREMRKLVARIKTILAQRGQRV